MITVLFYGEIEAHIKDYRWTSKEKSLENLLNAALDPLGPSGSDPEPDWNAARDAARNFEGEIITKYVESDDVYPPDAVL